MKRSLLCWPLFLVWLAISVHAVDTYAQNVIAVVSDIHLMFGEPEHINQKTFSNFLNILKARPANKRITDIIVNGDIYHGPTVTHVERQQRIKMTIDVLRQIQNETGVQVHFNIGNHDQQVERKKGGQWVADESFSTELKEAAEKANIAVIGIDPAKIYEYQIGNTKFKISHYPFATSKTMMAQAERFSANQRAYSKVTKVPEYIEHADGFVRIMSDSHTPLTDTELNAFNTGKLAETANLPSEKNTFLFIQEGRGQLMTLKSDGTVARFRSPLSCRMLFM